MSTSARARTMPAAKRVKRPPKASNRAAADSLRLELIALLRSHIIALEAATGDHFGSLDERTQYVMQQYWSCCEDTIMDIAIIRPGSDGVGR